MSEWPTDMLVENSNVLHVYQQLNVSWRWHI